MVPSRSHWRRPPRKNGSSDAPATTSAIIETEIVACLSSSSAETQPSFKRALSETM